LEELGFRRNEPQVAMAVNVSSEESSDGEAS